MASSAASPRASSELVSSEPEFASEPVVASGAPTEPASSSNGLRPDRRARKRSVCTPGSMRPGSSKRKNWRSACGAGRHVTGV
eukprot:1867865-Prymnesium_polylepis.1